MLRKASVPAHPFQGVDEPRGELVQFACMVVGQAAKQLMAFPGYAQNCTALVGGVDRALKEPFAFGAVHQLNGAIVLQLKPLRGVSNGDGCRMRCSSYLKKKLVLLRLQARLEGGALRKVEEPAQLSTKVGKSNEKTIRIGNGNRNFHLFISYHDISTGTNHGMHYGCT